MAEEEADDPVVGSGSAWSIVKATLIALAVIVGLMVGIPMVFMAVGFSQLSAEYADADAERSYFASVNSRPPSSDFTLDGWVYEPRGISAVVEKPRPRVSGTGPAATTSPSRSDEYRSVVLRVHTSVERAPGNASPEPPSWRWTFTSELDAGYGAVVQCPDEFAESVIEATPLTDEAAGPGRGYTARAEEGLHEVCFSLSTSSLEDVRLSLVSGTADLWNKRGMRKKTPEPFHVFTESIPRTAAGGQTLWTSTARP